jgi:hypothetical protein
MLLRSLNMMLINHHDDVLDIKQVFPSALLIDGWI